MRKNLLAFTAAKLSLKAFFPLFFFLFCNSYLSICQTGVLDVTFGNGGKVVTHVSDSGCAANAIALQSDGKIVAVGNSIKNRKEAFAVVRYNTDGTVDNTFGIGGKVTTVLGNIGDIANTVTIQSDGKIVVAGSMAKPYSSTYGVDNDFAIVRYNGNGILDSSFGKNGITTTDFENGDDEAYSLVIKPNGKIIVAGVVKTSVGGFNYGLVQYHSNGSLDSAFGINGKVFTDINANSGDAVKSLVIQGDGKILAGGNANGNTEQSDFAVVRYLENGKIDSSFGVNGIAVTDFGSTDDYGLSLAISTDNKIVLGGEQFIGSNVNAALVRYNINGTVDSTFGINGKVTTDLDNFESAISSVIIQPDGKIMAAGGVGVLNSMGDVENLDFTLIRYNTQGTLDYSFGKRGVITTDFAGFNDLSYASTIQTDGKVVLAGSVSGDSSYSYDGSTYSFALARYERNAFLYYNALKGSVFLDNNSNGVKDSNEPFYNNAKVTATKAGIDTITEISNTGKFSLDVDTGAYTITVQHPLPYYNLVPASQTISHTNYFNTDSISFALQPIPGKKDLTVSLIPETAARPGFATRYRLLWRNQGTEEIIYDTVQLIKSSKLNFLSSSFAPTHISGDTLRWEFSAIKPFDIGNIFIDFTVASPPTVNNGDTLRSTATIFPVSGDVTPADNVSALLQTVVRSYDPNDKTESHGGVIRPEQIANGEYITYTIRFENTGSDTAFNVVIKDTLSNQFDWSTLQMIAASKNYQLNINDGNKCVWYFNNILLPDSNRNERSSHGYLVFRIKPTQSVTPGDTIKNTAAIYFDYNLPVKTNTERTTVVTSVLPVKLVSFTARRDSKTNVTEWSTSKEINFSHFEIERSLNAIDFTTIDKVTATSKSDYSFTDEQPEKAINYYRLKMIDKDGKFEYSAVRSVNNTSSFEVSIYPNPARENLTVKIHSDKKANVHLEVIGLDGKVLLSKQVNLSSATSSNKINISSLIKGSYLLRIRLSDKEQMGIRFEKM